MHVWACVLALVFLAGCGGKAPPEPVVTLNKEPVPVVLSTHCWSNGCADYPLPEEHLAAANYVPFKIPYGEHANLAVEFDAAPPKGFTVTHWVNGKPDSFDPIRGRRVTMSLSLVPGVHTFSIAADWKQGSAIHLFQMDVPER